ncbi:MAG TPA: hypothetical protein VK252_08060 [Solirubrobacteraceae bacterium]|nr:hypothetical protein [Solirubrobacteraceae bacterium]
MATRSIVTSQPDVECDVCERRLLRGEQPDVFIAAGRRQLVCELCAPRAVQEGWLREAIGRTDVPPATRPRRRRSLFARLPVPSRARQVTGSPNGASETSVAQPPYEGTQEPYEFLDAPGQAAAAPVPARGAAMTTPAGDLELVPDAAHDGAADGHSFMPNGRDLTPAGAVAAPDSQLQLAVAAFNAGEHPRRVAGVARALGAPAVSVRYSEHARSVVTIVIAWELCWYRYEVDLDEVPPVAHAVGQGTELGELLREESVANALADESGTLRLSDAVASAPHSAP